MTSLLPMGELEKQLLSRKTPGVAYGYARVSTVEQTANDSIDGQKQRIYEYYLARLKPSGVEWGGAYVDPGVSAFKTPFEKRPAGAKLLSQLKEGDHVIVDRVDRMCRSSANMHKLIQYATDHKLAFHFLDCNLDPTTPMGEMIIGVIAILAQLDSGMKGKRISEAHAYRMRTGDRIVNLKSETLIGKSTAKCGIRVKQKDGIVNYYIRWHEFAACKFIMENIDQIGWAWRSICYREAQINGVKYGTRILIDKSKMLISRAGAQKIPYHWERYMQMLLKAVPWTLYPPAEELQCKEVLMARARLNSRGEVVKWKAMYEQGAKCAFDYQLVSKELLYRCPNKSFKRKRKNEH
jgi:DNA invertase Pin-like site-specific DNA recombinase